MPIVISYRKVTEKPEIRRTRRFVGWSRVLKNVAIKAIEFVQDICYETESEVLNAGKQRVVHWAVEVDNPWGCGESSLVAVRVPDKPACGAHFEIITIEEDTPADVMPEEPVSTTPINNHRQQQQNAIRDRLRARMEREGGIVR